MMSNLEGLSTELLLRVVFYLNDKDLSHLGRANKFLSKILSQSLITRSLEDQPPRVVKVNALTWAIQYGHASLVKRIVSQPGFSRFGVQTAAALHEAAAIGNCDMISILVLAGYGLETQNAGKTPLHIAVMNGHSYAANLLIHFGADVAAKDQHERTAFTLAIGSSNHILEKLQREALETLSDTSDLQLKYAVETRVVATLRILVKNGAHAELFMANRSGDTPMHQAVYQCHGFSGSDLTVGSGVLQYLVSQGAHMWKHNTEGQRPIDEAAGYASGCPTALKFFLSRGASPNSTNRYGVCLLQQALACDPDAFPLIELLLARGARIPDGILLRFFSEANHPDPVLFDKILTLLMIHGATFGTASSQCFTYAAHHGMFGVMKTVFDAGADVNTAVRRNGSRHDRTPLEIAIRKRRADMVAFLVERGVEISVQQEDKVERILEAALA